MREWLENNHITVHRNRADGTATLTVTLRPDASAAPVHHLYRIGRDTITVPDYREPLYPADSLFAFLSAVQCEHRINPLHKALCAVLFKPRGIREIFSHICGFGPDRFFQESQLKQCLHDIEFDRRKRAVRSFLRGLPAPIVGAMRRINNDSPQLARFLLAGGDKTLQTRRTQAIEAYPILFAYFTPKYLNLLTTPDRYDAHREAAAELDAGRTGVPRPVNGCSLTTLAKLWLIVDRGLPLAPFLQNECVITDKHLSARTLKSLGRIKDIPPPLHSMLRHDKFPWELLPFLDELDPAQHPRNGAALYSYLVYANRATRLGCMTGQPTSHFLRLAHGRWDEWREKTGSDTEVRDISDWLRAVHDLFLAPHLRDHARMIGMPGELNWRHEDTLTSVFAASHSPLELLDCSRRWHEQYEGFTARRKALRPRTPEEEKEENNPSWLPLSPVVKLPDGISVEPLTSRSALEQAGAFDHQGLHHCVGSYWTLCRQVQDHIVCLRDESGRRLTTAHLREQWDNACTVTDLVNLQHRGLGNRDATAKEENALKTYIGKVLNDPRLRPDFARMESAREGYRATSAKNDLGYDPEDPAQRRAAAELIRNYLPSSYRCRTADELVTMPQGRAFAEKGLALLRKYNARNWYHVMG